jgi:drug/metabolite transporter (DMT)-like permease
MILCFAVLGVVLKLAAARGVNVIEMIFYRNLITFPLALVWVQAGPGLASLRTKRPLAHLTRTAVGLIGMLLNFLALLMLPLPEATAIGFTAPLFATVLSALFLREHVGLRRVSALLVGMVGMLLIVQPGNFHLPPLSLAVGVASAVGVAIVTITVRELGTTELPGTTVVWFSLSATVAMGLLMPYFGARHDLIAWSLIACIGLLGCLTQLLQASSLRLAPISVLVPFDYTQLLWAAGLTWLVWSTLPGMATVLGGLLIALSGIYTVMREQYLRNRG